MVDMEGYKLLSFFNNSVKTAVEVVDRLKVLAQHW
jgi:hypothetical protein